MHLPTTIRQLHWTLKGLIFILEMQLSLIS
jgi:hypothetical protein